MSLKSLLRQATTLHNRTGFDGFGKEQFGSGSTVAGRVQVVSKPRLGPNDTQYVIAAIIYYPASTTVNEGDKITYSGVTYRVHGITLSVDGIGNTAFKKIECTKWNI